MFLDEKKQGEQALSNDKPLELWQQVLRKAAKIIEEDGWCQRNYRGADGGHCIVGALSVAARVDARADRAGLIALSKLQDAVGCRHYDPLASAIIGWNDAPGRTVEHVLDLLRRTAGVG